MKMFVVELGVLCALGVVGCADDTLTGDPSIANCGAFCDKAVECTEGASRSVCILQCNAIASNEAAISEQCVAGFAAVNACVSELSCEQRDAWFSEIPPDSYPCKAEDDAGEAACGGGT